MLVISCSSLSSHFRFNTSKTSGSCLSTYLNVNVSLSLECYSTTIDFTDSFITIFDNSTFLTSQLYFTRTTITLKTSSSITASLEFVSKVSYFNVENSFVYLTGTSSFDNTTVTLNGTSQVRIYTMTFTNSGIFSLYDNSIVIVYQASTLSNIGTQLIMFNRSLFNTPTLEMYSGSVLNQFNKAWSLCKNVTLYGSSVIQLNNFSCLNGEDTFIVKEKSKVELRNTANIFNYTKQSIFGQGEIDLYDNSYIYTSSLIKLYENGLIVLNNKSFIMLNGDLNVQNGGILQMYNSTSAIVQSFTLLNGGVLRIETNTSKPSVITNKFDCEASIIVTDKSYIVTNELIIKTPTFNVNTRSIKNVPLFQTPSIDIIQFGTITSDNEFDFAFSSIPFNFTLNNDKFTFLQDKRLLRYGKSTDIFCHLNNSIVNSDNYVEPYCPCKGEKCYITPLEDIAIITLNEIDFNFTEEFNESFDTKVKDVLYIENIKVSFHLIKTLVVYINSTKSVIIGISDFTKHALIYSESGILLNNTNCTVVEANKKEVNCLLLSSYCPTLINYNLERCEGCLDENCRVCANSTHHSCVLCNDGFLLLNNSCETAESHHCIFATKNFCVKCEEGFAQEEGFCVKRSDFCQTQSISDVSNESFCLLCDTTSHKLLISGTCVDVPNNSLLLSQTHVIACKNTFVTNGTYCESCASKFVNCDICEQDRCTKCAVTYRFETNPSFTSKGSPICVSDVLLSSNTSNSVYDQNGMYEVNSTNRNCMYYINSKCVECSSDFILTVEGSCVLEANSTHCALSSPFGCIRCGDGYFLSHNKNCEICDGNCSTCLNKTFCLTCAKGNFISKNRCYSNEMLKESCETFSTTGDGCYSCKDSFYRIGLDCQQCDEKCDLCIQASKCLVCNATNFKAEDGECLPQSLIIGCSTAITTNGCSSCQQGYYTIKANQCERCPSTCSRCSSSSLCYSCLSNYVLESGECVDYRKIENCVSADDSKCSKCAFWHTPTSTGRSCQFTIPWWCILLLVIFILLVVILCTTLLFYSVKIAIQKRYMKQMEEGLTIFKMERSNIKFTRVSGDIMLSTTTINFNEINSSVPINIETRQLFCVGNSSTNRKKIQVVLKDSKGKFTLRTLPEVVILNRNEACEFEIFINPQYTCKIEDKIVLISVALSHPSQEIVNTISITAETVISTRLNPDDIITEKVIGEGSFGTVFKGTFHSNTVAIKKIKERTIDYGALEDFEAEVKMLDKFRSEYIVYFYGAVFLPNNISLVTEYATYGSLNDFMKQSETLGENPPDISLRKKIMVDASNGIKYLHTNGILHRDLKPDNILIVSIEQNILVNGKLTDFGSSRNINLLMTNMTFTKGVGTPKYMAPEILNKMIYNKAADIYSFGVTMFECFAWKEAYKGLKFKFAWNIADFIIKGKRLENTGIDKNLFGIVEKCWKQNPLDRPQIQEVCNELQYLI
ncbi:protein serine/threonine kinase, putative [Entamoeba invadens IP1]|uniref:Protein serine/threonine kinase, putative n=1 Tax=Entamoeba invadens IP1 TaxID=370355 RepID=A0A0A1U4T3_ENTIV|nr:protein serine/threonine kinase, putative [Entamoeba invadens IP1]ELP89251.1 protein serine/threonine kinase, putative [Entamoeba invadens IP1]|eukprot:XP_004256022.1 protein serine/threonine kinase, putative [Entamoeba invadens IP1]